MTLLVAASTPHSAWLLADRRLSWPGGRMRDDALKVFHLDATDGSALIGYAGLGLTASGMEPSEWMSRALIRRKLTMEESLGVLADAIKKRIPKHLSRIGVHNVFGAGFVNKEPRLYSIDVATPRLDGRVPFRFTRYLPHHHPKHRQSAPLIGLAGSGVMKVLSEAEQIRQIRRVLRAHDRGAMTPRGVAGWFARLNNRIHQKDSFVGNRCIVAWRFRAGGGGHEFFVGDHIEPQSNAVVIPTIGHGMDVAAIVRISFMHLKPAMSAMRNKQPPPADYAAAIDADLAKLPKWSDDTLD